MRGDIKLSSRRESSKATRKVFLIVCEGSKTEPGYFSSFRLPKHVYDIEGCGANTGTVVKEATRLSKVHAYDEVWCVFDRDSFPRHAVNAAVLKAEQAGFNVAFSNESFELWYVLHFCYLDVAQSRDQYCGSLSGFLGKPYKKNSNEMYDLLFELQPTAIKNAKRLEKNVVNASWANRIPYTGVYLLVERLNKELKKLAGKPR
jgi:hypothetical protein